MPGCVVCGAKAGWVLHGTDPASTAPNRGWDFYPYLCDEHLVRAAKALYEALGGSVRMKDLVTRVLLDPPADETWHWGVPSEAEWVEMELAYEGGY